jgi:4-amino-4-deoxy-L-arabinose transferase-like glycosyltransferase
VLEAESSVACGGCGQSNRVAARFCRRCGAKLAHLCSSCGNDLPAEARFCDVCGCSVASGPTAPRQIATPVRNAPLTPPATSVLSPATARVGAWRLAVWEATAPPSAATQSVSATRVLVLLGAVLLVASAARLWELGAIPAVFFHDECDNTVNAIQILQGKGPSVFGMDWKPQPALAVNLIALAIRATGPSVAAVRFPSALFSVLALVPFFFLAQRVAGFLPALLAALLLAFNVGYLHFSRSGWENVQICFYSLVAMEAVSRAEAEDRLAWWSIAGLSAALGAYVYFAGRAIIAFLLLYVPFVFLRHPNRRRRTTAGAAVMALTFAVVVVPLYPSIRDRWTQFNFRTREVLITRELPADASLLQVGAKAVAAGVHSLQAPFNGTVNNQPRYSPVGVPLLDRTANVLLLVGLIASLRVRATALWWMALIVPFFLTQMLTRGTPDLARGIGLLPVAYLFVALGMASIIKLVARRRSVAEVAFILLATLVAVHSGREYFAWATGGRLTTMLYPAVELEDFDEWWKTQNEVVRAGRGILNTDTWQAQHKRGVPSENWLQPTGTVYRGSTSGEAYAIDLGAIALQSGDLQIEVFAVPGADCVYDYVEVVGQDGRPIRVEAEDPQHTSGDRPVPYNAPDNHWWLQDYETFSGGQGLVALKSETPPPLITRVQLQPGTYHVRLGSFSGDPRNGVFAIQVNMHERASS